MIKYQEIFTDLNQQQIENIFAHSQLEQREEYTEEEGALLLEFKSESLKGSPNWERLTQEHREELDQLLLIQQGTGAIEPKKSQRSSRKGKIKKGEELSDSEVKELLELADQLSKQRAEIIGDRLAEETTNQIELLSKAVNRMTLLKMRQLADTGALEARLL